MLAVRDFVLWKPLNESLIYCKGSNSDRIRRVPSQDTFSRFFLASRQLLRVKKSYNREIGSCQSIHWFKRVLFRWFSEISQESGRAQNGRIKFDDFTCRPPDAIHPSSELRSARPPIIVLSLLTRTFAPTQSFC